MALTRECLTHNQITAFQSSRNWGWVCLHHFVFFFDSSGACFSEKTKTKHWNRSLTKKPVSVICACVYVLVFPDSAVLLCCTYTGMALNAFLLCLTYSATCIRYRTVLGKHPHTITSTNIQYLAQPLSKATYYIHCCLVFQWKHQRSLIVHKTGPV